MTRLVIHNYTTRSIGRFRATAVADHSRGKCSCGGPCCSGKDATTTAEVGIDVRYKKGGYGSEKTYETRHYTIPGAIVDPRGYPPTPQFIRQVLSDQPGHRDMRRAGWDVDDVKGYYKKEHRDVGARI